MIKALLTVIPLTFFSMAYAAGSTPEQCQKYRNALFVSFDQWCMNQVGNGIYSDQFACTSNPSAQDQYEKSRESIKVKYQACVKNNPPAAGTK